MGKKIFISQDMEGISGVVNLNDLLRKGDDYNHARLWVTEDINAAVEGAIKGGADDLTVREAHHGIIYHKLHPKAKLIRGMPSSQWIMDCLDRSFDAVMGIGFHARSGDGAGILSHTWLFELLDVKINDILMSEARIGALIAGYYDVPLVMVSGDDIICKEVEQWNPGVETAVVKYALNRYGATCLSMVDAQKLIKEKAEKAMGKIDEIEPYKLDPPYKLEIQTIDPSQAHRMHLLPGTEYDGNRTISYTCDDFLVSHRAFLTMVHLSYMEFYVKAITL